MNLADLPDRRLRKLANTFRVAEKEIRLILTEMVTATPAFKIDGYRRIQRIVVQLRENAQRWAERYSKEFFTESLAKVTADLEAKGIETANLTRALESAPLRNVVLGLVSRIDQALFTVVGLAGRIVRAATIPDLFDAATRAKYVRLVNAGTSIEEATARSLRKFHELVIGYPVTITSKTGKPIHYELAYYTSVVAASAMVVSQNLAPLLGLPAAGLDLVRVSANPSLHGDYCDAYAGRVFSISGEHPKFPALTLTPNGGPPFHPHCYHTLEPVDPRADLSNEAVVANSFQSADPKAVASAWKQRSR